MLLTQEGDIKILVLRRAVRDGEWQILLYCFPALYHAESGPIREKKIIWIFYCYCKAAVSSPYPPFKKK